MPKFETGVAHSYDKDGNEIDSMPKETLAQKNARIMANFESGEAYSFDKDGNEIDSMPQETLAQKKAREMAKYETGEAYSYDKDGNEIDSMPKESLAQKNAREMKKYFGEGEYGVINYDKDGNVIDNMPSPKEGASAEMSDAEKLEMLKSDVEAARKSFAKADYEWDKKNRWFRKMFGKKGQVNNLDTRTEAFSDYKRKLEELYKHQSKGLEGLDEAQLQEKMNEMHKYFDTDEKINLYEARTNARTEAWEGNLGGKAMKKAGDFVNWYRKQNVWAKGAVGAALTLSGMGAAAAGMRVLGGAAAGVGVTTALEARHRRKEMKTSGEDRKRFLEKIKSGSLEEKLNQHNDRLDAIIGEYRRDLSDEKKEAFRRKAIGTLVGVFIGSGAMSSMIKDVAHWAGDTSPMKAVSAFWKNKLDHLFSHSNVGPAVDNSGAFNSEGITSGVHESGGAPIGKEGFPFNNDGILKTHEHGAQGLKITYGNVDHNALNQTTHIGDFNNPKAVNLEVHAGKGGSLEGTIIKHLKSLGISSQEAGAKAHRIALQFADTHKLPNGPYSLIHPGAHIEMTPGGKDGFIISGISDEKGLGYLHHNTGSHVEHIKADPEHMKKVFHPGNAETLKTDALHQADKTVGLNVPKAIDLEVHAGKGGSLEGTIIKHLKSLGISSQEAGARAHSMAVDYAKLHHLSGGPQSLIHPGAHIELTPDGKDGFVISKISDGKGLGYLHNHAGTNVEHLKADAEHVKKVFHPGSVENHPSANAHVEAKPGVSQPEVHQAQPVHPEMNAGNYGYENFSGDMDKSVQELSGIKEKIFSEYKGTINNDEDIFYKLEELEGKLNQGSRSDAMYISPLTLDEEKQLEALKGYKAAFSHTYSKIMDSLFDLKDDSNVEFFNDNAQQYFNEHPGGRAAKILEGLRRTMSPEEMAKNNLNPKPGDKVSDWGRRVIKYMLVNKIEHPSNG